MNISIKSLVKGISALCIVSMSAIDMAAVPATPYPITKTLPDGTELTVRLHGDEHGSFVTTTDGYLLMQDASGFYINKIIIICYIRVIHICPETDSS